MAAFLRWSTPARRWLGYPAVVFLLGSLTTLFTQATAQAWRSCTMTRPSQSTTLGWAGNPIDLVQLGCAVTGLVLTGWLTLALLLAGIARLPGVVGMSADRVMRRTVPAGLRRVATTVLGSVLASTAMAVPAAAHGNGVLTDALSRIEAVATVALTNEEQWPDPGWTPSDLVLQPSTAKAWTEATASPQATRTNSAHHRTGAPSGPGAPRLSGHVRHDATVTVVPGDTLWGLARAQLDADLNFSPSPARIERRWRQWYAKNRTLIGADPDLIHPGIVLTTPTTQRRPR